jgi:hypothetical protein
MESKDEDKKAVTSTASAQRDLENTVVRFRWVDGFLVIVEADRSASVDHVNFLKGILSALQVYSPAPSDEENTVSSSSFAQNANKQRNIPSLSCRCVKKTCSVFVPLNTNTHKRLEQHT